MAFVETAITVAALAMGSLLAFNSVHVIEEGESVLFVTLLFLFVASSSRRSGLLTGCRTVIAVCLLSSTQVTWGCTTGLVVLCVFPGDHL